MKNNFKYKMLTGIASVALVAPLILGGFSNNAHASNTPAAQHEETQISNGSLKGLGAVAPSTSNNESNLNNVTPTNVKNIPSKASIINKGKVPNTNKPTNTKSNNKHHKTISMKQLKKIMAKQRAKQKKTEARMLKGSKTIFIKQGKMVYTVKAKTAAKNAQVFPFTMKKFMPYKHFKRVARSKEKLYRKDIILYQRTHRIKYFRKAMKKRRYLALASMPTQKQQLAAQKKAAKASNKRKRNKFIRHHKKHGVVRHNHKSTHYKKVMKHSK